MRALIVGGTGGIGAAVAQLLRSKGHDVTGLSRSNTGLDLRQPDSIDTAFSELDGVFDLVVVATGQLHGAEMSPEKSLRTLTAEAMADQFAVNTIGPAMILRHMARLLPKSSPAKVVVLTARVGSIGDNALGGWYSYRAAKAATNQIVHTAAIELARSHKHSCVIAYHPGTVATHFTTSYQGSHKTISPEQAAGHLLDVVNGIDAEHSGQFHDWTGAVVPW
jgi:NAD(P)-dependent dehydrogenase (short-subunit alcohol dehydrogenase family)